MLPRLLRLSILVSPDVISGLADSQIHVLPMCNLEPGDPSQARLRFACVVLIESPTSYEDRICRAG
jgi:hypothetical protein